MKNNPDTVYPDPKIRVGGRCDFRKPGKLLHQGSLIEWIYQDGTLRVNPEHGQVQLITINDIRRAER